MNCHASIPGPCGDRDWWDSGPVQPPEPGKPTIMPYVLAVLAVLAGAMVLGGCR